MYIGHYDHHVRHYAHLWRADTPNLTFEATEDAHRGFVVLSPRRTSREGPVLCQVPRCTRRVGFVLFEF